MLVLVVLFWLFMIVSCINIIHFGLFLVGANCYDILKMRKHAKVSQKRRHDVIRPLVSVLIPAHNEEASIVGCLDSVRTNTYRKLEIIVIDDASTDRTRQIVRKYIEEHPHRNIRLMYKQKNVGKANALNHALRHGAHGDLVMTLDGDSLIHKKAITNAVRYFNDPKVVGVAANVRVLDSKTVLGLLQKFEYMVGYRSKKFFSVTNSEFIIGGVASTYRRETLKQVGYYDTDIQTEDIALSLKVAAQGNRANRLVYGVDVLAMTQGVLSFKALLKQRYRWKMGSLQSMLKYKHLFANNDAAYSRMLTLYRIPMAFLGEIMLLAEPFALAYVMYLCYQAGNINIIIGAYATITLYLMWNVLNDEHMSMLQKLRMCAYAPIMYFIMYIMNVVQVTAIVRCLINYQQILRKVDVRSHWQSPERQGLQQVKFS